ncbi:MAG: hypothetical protein FD138_798 [Planctomycetota bacterium]|nr:MAG: hypothetical protein FD138_798 [Planctomycetota bacterium]
MSQSSPTSRRTTPAERLRSSTAAVRLSLRWFGVHKTLNAEQKAEAAEAFGATGDSLSAGKKLLDTRHPAYRAVNNTRGRIQSMWKGLSLPYPEPAIRLIRRDDIERLHTELTSLRLELADAVEQLDRRYAELRTAAQQRLGRLFNLSDYPASLRGLFAVEWDFPSIEPPDYLRQLNPELYEQECRRVAARFDEALQMSEQAFVAELSQLVAHLTERLSGTDDGKPKVFRDIVVSNLTEFFERFRRLNVRSNEQLDTLVSQVEDLVNGVQPQSLRENQVLRQVITAELSQLQPVFDGLLVDRPRRNILRQAGAIPVQEAV